MNGQEVIDKLKVIVENGVTESDDFEILENALEMLEFLLPQALDSKILVHYEER